MLQNRTTTGPVAAPIYVNQAFSQIIVGGTGASPVTFQSNGYADSTLAFRPEIPTSSQDVFIAPAAAIEVLAATPAGVATVTADLKERVSLAASAAGVASVSGNLTERVALAASSLGAAVVTADLSGTEPPKEVLAAVVTGTATVSANLTERLGLAATPAGSAVVTAGLTERLGLQATVAGVAVVTANLRERVSLLAVVAGTAVVTADLSGTTPGASFNVNTQGVQQPPAFVIWHRDVP